MLKKHMAQSSNSPMDIIAFLVHAVIFILLITYAVANPSLFQNQNYIDILYILLSTLILHGGYAIGRKS
jgi:hypothetical protein